MKARFTTRSARDAWGAHAASGQTARNAFANARVLLDADLAALYGVSTGALVQAVKRNLERFPEDFIFQLTADE